MPLALVLGGALAVAPVQVEKVPEPTHDDLQAVVPRAVGIRGAPYMGVLSAKDDRRIVMIGVDLQLALRHLRVMGFAEAGAVWQLGRSLGVTTVGAAVGIGTDSYGELDAYLAPEVGLHHYSGRWSSTTDTTDRAFVGLRGGVTWHVGPGRHFGFGVTGMTRTDVSHSSVGGPMVGLALHVALAF